MTPFVISGYVFNADDSACNAPVVTVTNNDTGKHWTAENDSGSNYYQIVLAAGVDVNASEVLKFEFKSPDGTQLKEVTYTVAEDDINAGGKFLFNATLASTNAQAWYLTPDAKPSGAPEANDSMPHVKDNLMHKGSPTATGDDYFGLDSSQVAWFYADRGAECELGFGEKAWKAHIRTGAVENTVNLTVEICRLNSAGEITVIAAHTEQLQNAGDKHMWDITCEDNPSTTQDFNTGDWLAVRLSIDGSPVNIYYGGTGSDSYIESPPSDPGYPVPELSTLVLCSLGLIAIAGYVGIIRRRHR